MNGLNITNHRRGFLREAVEVSGEIEYTKVL
jgi:hypothetical protein